MTCHPEPVCRRSALTLATEDTRLTVGATDKGQLCIYELCNPAAGWNWTAEPSVFDLAGRVTADGQEQKIQWKHKDSVLDKTDGQKVTLRFVCEPPALELKSVWHARPGRGPVHHSIRITNRSDKPVTLFEQPTIHLDLAGRAGDFSEDRALDIARMWLHDNPAAIYHV